MEVKFWKSRIRLPIRSAVNYYISSSIKPNVSLVNAKD
jgi:hypothetical protein